MTSETASNLAAALEYRERGLALLPLKPGKKTPNTRVLKAVHGDAKWGDLAKRPVSPVEIRAWYECDPTTGLGILTGSPSENLVVVDVDKPAEFKRRHPPTPIVKTARGFHLYFRSSSPVRSKRTGFGEIRSNGNYVVAPPSVHESGSLYEWRLSPDDVGFADLDELGLGVLPIVRDISDLGEPSSVPESGPVTGNELAGLDPAVFKAARRVLGINANLGSPFRCVLPGHGEDKASASLFQLDGIWKYCDWHERDGRRWYTLAEVFAARIAGRVLAPFKSKPLTAMYYRRLWHQAGLRPLAPVELPRLRSGTPAYVERAREGFALRLALREPTEPDLVAPYTRRFVADWNGLTEDQAQRALRELRRQEVLVQVGEQPSGYGRPMHLYCPGPGPASLQRAERRRQESRA